MADKNGNPQQCRNARFSNRPMANPGVCPFKGPDIAIVPMRYALDRSRYDVDPGRLTPLSAEGKWKCPPKLQSRNYTLRQLRDGFVYVYDETDEALHEYRFSAQDASLTRIVWSDAGQDTRSASGESRSHLLYPRTHKLRMAFSPYQWTWRMCQLISASGVKRASWLRELDLGDYSRQMTAWHALPLTRLSKRVVADVDPHPVNHDGRFADSAHPPVADEEGKYPSVALAADVLWTGGVEDKFSSVLIALDDPLAMLEDLSMQLATDQAALHEFQLEHEHALNIAGVVEKLCGAAGDKSLLPASVLKDETKTRQYIRDVEAYFEQLQVEDDLKQSADGQVLGLIELPSAALGDELKANYGSLPNPDLRKSWQDRSKWRREVDLQAAREYSDTRNAQLKTLRAHVIETQNDIKALVAYIGTDPIRLFIDTTHSTSLLCLLDVVSDLLCNLSQDLGFSRWLQEEEENSKTLFGHARFGFSHLIKDAMTNEANRVMQGISDVTALVGRAGELNGFLTHDALAEKPWIKALSEPAQMTLNALVDLAKGAGKATLENIQLAFFPVDSRLAGGAINQNAALILRNLLMGHVLLNHPEKLQIDEAFIKQHAAWEAELKKGRDLYKTAQYRWLYQAKQYDRRALASIMQNIQHQLTRQRLNEPLLFDYRGKRYGQVMQSKIVNFFAAHGQLTQAWSKQAKAWSAEHGLNAGAITWGIAAINLLNTFVTYETASRDGELSKKDWAKVASAAAYTGNALMAVFVETGWGAMKGLEIFGSDSKPIKITQKSAAHWTRAGKSDWGKLIKGFGTRLVGLGGFAVIAASLEWWDIDDDYLNTDSALDKDVMNIKKISVLGFAMVGGAQLLAGIAALVGNGTLAALVMSPWFFGITALIGLVYLLSTLTLNYLKRDVVGHWLRKCHWSRYPDECFESKDEENQTFLEIQLAPALFIKPTFHASQHYFPDIGYLPTETQNGAWVQLRLPGAIRGELAHVNLTATGRPFPGFPVERLGDSLKDCFSGYGTVEAVAQWRRVSLLKTQTRFNEPPQKISPPADEDVIWQTWVPLTESAQYLELQVWYSAQTLPIREGDKGYRYQIELIPEGETDGSESRVVGANLNSLTVESLGGRADALLLPLPL
ncbi:toxin VasX [Pseudomonas viridiflava]|uniref:toxin VasX n=1 Tax=Pseudomonas viridiflava TaxID=33069 RepID=UPI000F04A414|nr:toxin VasX [Pseudomonas viridiflava]